MKVYFCISANRVMRLFPTGNTYHVKDLVEIRCLEYHMLGGSACDEY